MNSRRLSVIVILVALSIGTNYAMVPLFNVKFMDLIVFVGGFCFGPVVGVLIGVMSWGVYGSLNPLGFSLPIWFSTMFSESIYGVGGAFLRRSLGHKGLGKFRNGQVGTYVFLGVFGMFMTFVYDVVTNVVFGFVSGWNVLFAVVVGFVPFGLVHMVSNAFFFGVGCVPAINAILRVVGGENSGIHEK